MYAVHLKDFKKNDKGKFEDCLPGDGGLDVAKLVKFLVDNQFERRPLVGVRRPRPRRDVPKALARVKEAVQKAKA